MVTVIWIVCIAIIVVAAFLMNPKSKIEEEETDFDNEIVYSSSSSLPHGAVSKTWERIEHTTHPECPYCDADFSNRNKPRRRSSFKCPSCSQKVFVEPYQPIYPSSYLTEEQSQYVWYLLILDEWICARGSSEDYYNEQQALQKKFGCVPGVGDVIWGLMNKSIVINTDKFNIEMIQEHMEEFRIFEKSLKEAKKQDYKSCKVCMPKDKNDISG